MAVLAGAVGLVTALVLSYFFSRAKNMPNQSSEPTLASGTSPAGQEPRLP
jgi:hypothetical protein